jgi:hypothetical protein
VLLLFLPHLQGSVGCRLKAGALDTVVLESHRALMVNDALARAAPQRKWVLSSLGYDKGRAWDVCCVVDVSRWISIWSVACCPAPQSLCYSLAAMSFSHFQLMLVIHQSQPLLVMQMHYLVHHAVLVCVTPCDCVQAV